MLNNNKNIQLCWEEKAEESDDFLSSVTEA